MDFNMAVCSHVLVHVCLIKCNVATWHGLSSHHSHTRFFPIQRVCQTNKRKHRCCPLNAFIQRLHCRSGLENHFLWKGGAWCLKIHFTSVLTWFYSATPFCAKRSRLTFQNRNCKIVAFNVHFARRRAQANLHVTKGLDVQHPPLQRVADNQDRLACHH